MTTPLLAHVADAIRANLKSYASFWMLVALLEVVSAIALILRILIPGPAS